MNLITKILFPLCLLFPITTFGETMDDLVERDGLYYKKFTDVPFTGTITGKSQGEIKNGRKDGSWTVHHDNGQLWWKGTYKHYRPNGPWVWYHDNGQLSYKGTYKDGYKVGPWTAYWNNGGLKEKR